MNEMTNKEITKRNTENFLSIVENNYDFYRNYIEPLECNYYKKYNKNTFNEEKAIKGIINLMIKPGIALFRKEEDKNFTLKIKQKKIIAKEFLENLLSEFEAGNYPTNCN